MSEINNRERLIRLMQILQRETDEESSLYLEQIIEKMKKEFNLNDINIDKRSLINDIKVLNRSGFEVFKENGENQKTLYSHKNKFFELYQLRILIDAVSSARFITPGETKKIIDKIKQLTGTTLAKKLQNQIYIDGRVKANNNQVRLWVDTLHTSICNQKKVSFQYGNYNMDKEFILHRNGEYYLVDPYMLVWSNDFYYLVGVLNNEPTFRNFRVDRMRNVKIKDLTYTKKPLNISVYLSEMFNMYPGEAEIVKIQFNKHLINAVLDRFGTEINIRKIDDEKFEVRFNAAINEGLIRWILMWGSDAKVVSPSSLVEILQDESNKMQELYRI